MGIKVQTEKSFQAAVIQYAKLRGYEVFHTYDSRRCEPGLPDLICLKEGRMIFAELKVGKNKTTKAQEKWLTLLKTVPSVQVHLWRPEDWKKIEEVLT